MNTPILSRFSAPKQSLIEYINTRVQISDEIKSSILAKCKIETLSKDHLLLKEGLIAHRLFFIHDGAARTFYFHEGKDVTSWIYREGHLMTSWGSFYARTPSHENIELVEDSIIYSITHDDLHQLFAEHSKMQQFGLIMIEEQMVYLDYFYKGFMFMTAKEKYDLLLSIFPDITQRINLGHIASFLGISQETLSRIRKKA